VRERESERERERVKINLCGLESEGSRQARRGKL